MVRQNNKPSYDVRKYGARPDRFALTISNVSADEAQLLLEVVAKFKDHYCTTITADPELSKLVQIAQAEPSETVELARIDELEAPLRLAHHGALSLCTFQSFVTRIRGDRVHPLYWTATEYNRLVGKMQRGAR